MKKLLMLLLVATMVFSIGCTKEDDVDVFAEMTDYMVDSGLDLPAMIAAGWYQTAATINDGDYYVIDIRSATDYNNGHVPGAVNSTLADVLTAAEAAPDGKTIAVFCYSGQGAGHAVMALRLMKYDAVVALWGMSGWHTTLDKWSASVDSIGDGHANWATATPAAATTYDLPVFDSDLEDGSEILTERVEAMLVAGFKGVAGADVLAAPSSYYINNFWTADDWAHYGGINGAVQVNPLSIDGGEIENLDASATVVTYCWTGQTSSMVTAWLNVLGYDALSLTNGANSMIYNILTGHKWVASSIVDLPLD